MRGQSHPVPGRHRVVALYFHGGRTDGETLENSIMGRSWRGDWALCLAPPQPSVLLTLDQDLQEEGKPNLQMWRPRLREKDNRQDTRKSQGWAMNPGLAK